MAVLGLQPDQAATSRGSHSFGAAYNVEFTENAFDVRLNSSLADEQLGADLFVALACSYALKHFDLTCALGLAADAFRQFRCQGGRYAGLAGVYFANAFHQRVAGSIF